MEDASNSLGSGETRGPRYGGRRSRGWGRGRGDRSSKRTPPNFEVTSEAVAVVMGDASNSWGSGETRGPRYGGRRSRGWGRGRGDRSSKRTPPNFEVTSDGSRFYFPFWNEIERDATLLNNFKMSLKCIGGYSEDEKKNVRNDQSFLFFLNTKYFPDRLTKEMKVNLDLTIGDDEDDGKGELQCDRKRLVTAFHNLLSWILSNKEDYAKEMNCGGQETESNGDRFVFLANVFWSVVKCYHSRMKYSFYASCVDGITYLNKEKEEVLSYSKVNKGIKWFQRFKGLLTNNELPSDKVKCNKVYKCVLTSELGRHKVLYSAAIGCINPDKYEGEIKDCSSCLYLRHVLVKENDASSKNKLGRYRMLGWLLDLVLTGTPEALIGYGPENGIVTSLKLYQLADLELNGKKHHDLEALFVFVDELLSFVKEKVESKPGRVFAFTSENGSWHYTVSEEIEEDFLPEWFLKNSETQE